VLGNQQDAEDVFQAAFLVLARKADAIRKLGSVGSWLHGVAYRLARKAKTQTAKRQAREVAAPPSASPGEPLEDLSVREWQAILHEELDRLPEKYRAALLLCYWEGKTRDEAAQQLGLPRTTLRDQLDKARDLLRSRLVRRGLTPSAALFAALFAHHSAQAIAPALAANTAKAAVLFASKSGTAGLASATALALAQGVIRTMQIKSWTVAALVLILLGGVASGIGFLTNTPDDEPVDPPKQAAQQEEPKKIVPAGKPGVDAFGDPLPPGALARLGTVRFRHGIGVSLVAFSKDGSQMVFGGGGDVDNAIRIVDASTGKEFKTFELKSGEMPDALNLSPDGKILAVAWTSANTIQGAIVVWDTATGKELTRIDCGGPPGGMVFSPDGKVLVSVDFQRRLQVWDAAAGKKLHDLKDVEGRASRPNFSPDGKLMAFTTYLDKRKEPLKAFLYDTSTWRPVKPTPDKPLTLMKLSESLVFSPDGTVVAGSDEFGHLSFRDANTGELLERAKVTIQATATPIRSMNFSHDSKLLAVVCDDVSVWDVAKRKRLHTLAGAHTVAVFSPRESFLVTSGGPAGTVTGGGSPALRFWDPNTGKEILKNDSPPGAVQQTHWLPGGKLLAVSPAEDCYRLWDWKSGKQLAKVPTGVKYIWWSVVSPDGRFLAVSHWRGQPGDDTAIRIFDLSAGKEVHRVGSKGGGVPVGFTADGKSLVAAEIFDTFTIWDTATGKLSRRIDLKKELEPGFACRSMISGDGKSLALEVGEIIPVKPDPNDIDPGSRLPPVGYYSCVIDLATGKKRWRGQLRSIGVVDGLALSPDGKILAQGFGQHINLLDSGTGAFLRLLESEKEWKQWARQAGALAFTPNGKKLIAADERSKIYVWDVATGKELQRFTGHRGRIFSVSASPDNTMFATASEDSTILLWRLDGR
jgi:RNA polymerase sigma factor (sigma-70 family)